MKRNHWILLALALFLTGEIAHYIWSHWGLVTVHSKNTPVSQVIHSIEKQGHITIRSNVDPNTPVRMNVTLVTVAEALETLASVTDSRWRLAYVVGPDKGAIGTALATISAGQRNEGWKHYFVQLPPMGDVPEIMPDPRQDLWAVKPAKEPTLQSYLQEASRNVSASFMVPENWNPAVNSPPKAAAIGKSLPKLISMAHGKYEEVFLLQTSNREQANRGDRERNDDNPRLAGNFGRGFDRTAMDERMQNEINKLPAADREAAQRERDQRKQFFDSLKDMTPEQREASLQAMMSQPDVQDRMDNNMSAHEARKTPEQRISRAKNTLQRMSQATGGAKP